MSNKKRFQELKDLCSEKEKKARDLYKSIATKILERDLQLLLSSDKSSSDSLVRYKIVNGMLEILDERGDSFLWGFEVDTENKIRLGDIFMFNGRPESVTYVEDTDDEIVLPMIENVLKEYNDSIKYLEENPDINSYQYKYYSAHEETYCQNIFEVHDIVIRRPLK